MSGDKVELSLGLRYWIKSLPDTRPEYSDLKALMMVSTLIRRRVDLLTQCLPDIG